jgi:hypothetical protein
VCFRGSFSAEKDSIHEITPNRTKEASVKSIEKH